MDKLTPAQVERLALVAEELAEAIQIIGKILRHGLDDHHPDRPEATNRQLLERELGDAAAAITMMTKVGDLDREAIYDARDDKFKRVQQWLKIDENKELCASALDDLD